MKINTKTLIAFLALISIQFGYSQEVVFKASDIDIPYQEFTLPNGLRLIVHEDHKAPIVAVNMWYHVGSKDEKLGKSGFAHLFEHLMFNGSENFDDDYFQAIERIGGTNVNGTTNNDRTNYFQNVPVSALDQVLFLESDRMGHLLGVITQEKLDEQRGVVQNEKRQGQNQPYGMQWDYITKAMYPKGHPYSWTVIGEMEDLNAASLDDVHEWFKKYYGPNNAVIAVAGDVDPDDVYVRVKKYFGDIPPGPTLARYEAMVPYKENDSRQVFQDRVPETRIVQLWHTPPFGTREDLHFDLIASILSTGKNSRMYKELVYEKQSASSAFAFEASSEIASLFVTQTNVKPGSDPAEVESDLNRIINDFVKNGPTEKELARAKSTYFANFITGLEQIGGFGGKSDILASNTTYHGDPEYYKTQLSFIEEATIADLQATAKKWLTRGKHTLICEPFAQFTAESKGVDRSSMPEMGPDVSSSFPEVQRAELKNGLKVVLTQRKGVPTMVFDLMIDAGYASDQFASPGIAKLSMNLMDEGTKNMSSLEINEKLQFLGASLSASSDLDYSYLTMNTLKPSMDESLKLFADVVLNPAFPETEFERLKKDQVAAIGREKAQPFSIAMRVFPQYLYGEGHAYSMPLTGSGYEKDVMNFKRDDVVEFYNKWVKPNNSTLIVVGDIDMKTLLPKLESLLGKWKSGEVPSKNISKVTTEKSNVLYLMDRPESEQSLIIAGHLTNPYGEVDEISREAFVKVYGGQFTSRINMNLREDKHWAYGASGFVWGAKGQRPFVSFASVQTDKTAESATEVRKELADLVGSRPVTQEELDKVKTNSVLQLPGKWETNNSVSNSLNTLVKYELADDYWRTYDQNIRNLSLDNVRKTAKLMVHPDQVNWFMVGDKEKVIKNLEKLGFNEIVIVDPDGRPLNLTGKNSIDVNK